MNPEKIIKYSVPVFALAIISRSIEETSFIYYAVPVLCTFFIVLLLTSTKFKPQNGIKYHLTSSIFPIPLALFILPGIWFLLTSLWSSYPEISATRALYFILLSTGCIAAGILWVHYSAKGILDFLLPANIIIVLICLFSLITNIPSDSWTGGHGKGFMGFFGHQNLLASVILFTIPAVFSKLWHLVNSDQYKVNSENHLQHNAYSLKLSSHYLPLTTYFLLLASNLLLLLLTYSRAAILSLIFGVILFLLLNKNWKALAYSFVIAALFTIIIYSTPSLNQFADKIIKKDFPEFYSSRIWMWEPSYEAALEGGFTGLGYGISHPKIRSGTYSDHYENGRLIREKGNSVLALVEETGLIGLVLFLIPIVYVVRKFGIYNVEFRMNENKIENYTLYIIHSSLAAMLLHAQFEAWWVGVGSVQLPLFYIYLGLLVRGSIVQGLVIRSSKFNK